jgi:MYXO-CTERM domain-containing protein
LITVDAAGTTMIPGDLEFPVIDQAINTWNNATIGSSCSYLQVIDEGRKSLEVGNDKVNLIKFRDVGCKECGGAWCRPAAGNSPLHCNSAQAAGITTAVYVDDPTSSRDGAIIDADIEINGVNFKLSADGMSTSQQSCVAELRNTLTHELGHLHGLEHPCLAGGDPQRTDNEGNPVPSCSAAALPPKITEATMYNFQSCGETLKETLSPDDIQAICDIYPVTKDPGTCAAVGQTTSGGCCSASGRDRPELGLVLAGMVFLWMRRRKNSRAA